MIRLDSVTRKLQVVMGGAKTTTEATAIVSFFDSNKSGETTKGSTKIATTNGATDVDICLAPGNNFIRNIDTITVYNADSVTQTISIKIDDGGTDSILIKHALTTGQTLFYEHQQGWTVL